MTSDTSSPLPPLEPNTGAESDPLLPAAVTPAQAAPAAPVRTANTDLSTISQYGDVKLSLVSPGAGRALPSDHVMVQNLTPMTAHMQAYDGRTVQIIPGGLHIVHKDYTHQYHREAVRVLHPSQAQAELNKQDQARKSRIAGIARAWGNR